MSQQVRTLLNWNRAAFFLHLTSFLTSVVISIVYRDGSFRGVITNDLTSHVATYQLIWVDLPFPLITAFFHGMIGYNEWFQSIYLTAPGSPLRWIEYSVTASLMTWAILQLAGVQNVFLLILAGPLANICLQAQGFLQERFPKTRLPTWIGWLIFTSQWTLIWVYYGFSANKPWFVHSIVIGCFIWFLLFGAVQLSRASKYRQELSYIALSFSAKLYLTWNLLIAAATQP